MLISDRDTDGNYQANQESTKDMMKNATLKKRDHYTVDLRQLEGEGTFLCPKCGTIISPDDESEEVYKIVDTKVVNDRLFELAISCGSCGARIRLKGFEQILEI